MAFKIRIFSVAVIALLTAWMLICDTKAQVTFSRDWNPGKRGENPDFHNAMRTASAVCHLLINQVRQLGMCENNRDEMDSGPNGVTVPPLTCLNLWISSRPPKYRLVLLLVNITSTVHVNITSTAPGNRNFCVLGMNITSPVHVNITSTVTLVQTFFCFGGNGAPFIMYNFLDPKLSPKVTCSAPATDNFEATNLISDNEATRGRGFLAYTVIRPPVELEFEFLCPVEVSFITLQTQIGRQKCTGVEIFARNGASLYVSIGRAFYDNAGLTFCNSRQYSKRSPPNIHDPNNGLYFFKSDTCRVLGDVIFLKVVIFRTERSVPCLSSIKVFGKPGRACSQVTKNTIERLMNGVTTSVTSEALVTEECFQIPKDFIDDLTCEIMAIPMTLPSGKTVDRDTLEKHVENEKSFGRKPGDPFTGLKFTETRKPVMNVALKSRIDMFLMQNSDNPVVFGVKRTLGNNEVNGFKRLKSDNVQCCVCSELRNLYVIPCKHYFCRDCLVQLTIWECRICKKEFSKNEASRYHC